MAKARLIKVRRKVRIEGVLFLVFLVCLGIFTLAKTGLASYNIVLSNEQQRVAADKEEQRDAVRLLQTEVNELQERRLTFTGRRLLEEHGMSVARFIELYCKA